MQDISPPLSSPLADNVRDGPASKGPNSDDPDAYRGPSPPIAGPDPDLADVVRALGGNRGAFEALLRRHYARIHRIAWRSTGSRADAEDIAQEVCCTLVEKLGTFQRQAKFTTWLTGIVINACRDHRRRGLTLSRLRDRLAVLAGLAPRPDGRDAYRVSWLSSELMQLDPLLRETVILIVGEDLTHAEAAQALGVAESTISWRMHTARKQLSAPTRKDAPDEL